MILYWVVFKGGNSWCRTITRQRTTYHQHSRIEQWNYWNPFPWTPIVWVYWGGSSIGLFSLHPDIQTTLEKHTAVWLSRLSRYFPKCWTIQSVSPENAQCTTCLRASGNHIVDVRTEGKGISDDNSQFLRPFIRNYRTVFLLIDVDVNLKVDCIYKEEP